MRILRNYIIKELLATFLLSLVVFSFVLLIGNIIRLADLVINKGVELLQIGKILLLLLPYLLSYTIPISILVGTLFTFGRLSSDNETTAISANGISLYRIISPILVIGIVFSLFCLVLNDRILPQFHFASRKAAVDLGIKNPTAYFEPGTFIKNFDGYIIFIQNIHKNNLRGIRIYEPREGKPTRTIIADKGEFTSIPERQLIKLKLENGMADEFDPRNPNKFYKLNFKIYHLTLNLSENFERHTIEKKPKELTIHELLDEIKYSLSNGINPTPLITAIHKKIALSFSPIIFVLVGIPLAIKIKRKEKSSGFGLSLIIITGYYLLLAGGEAISLKGIAHPIINLHLPNILIMMTGCVLIYKTARES